TGLLADPATCGPISTIGLALPARCARSRGGAGGDICAHMGGEYMKLWNLLAVAGLTAGIANAGVIILDDFDADPNDDAGGPRSVSSMVISNPFSQPFNAAVDTGLNLPSGDVGAFVFNAGIGVKAKTTIRWDNNGAGLNLDLGALDITGFEI